MKKNKIVVGVDIGYGHTKVAAEDKHDSFPSVVGPTKDREFEPGGKAEDPGETVSFQGTTYDIGNKADRGDTTFPRETRDRTANETYGALMVSAISRVVKPGDSSANLVVVTGLPFAYMSDAATVKRQVGLAAEALSITLSDVTVIPQPFGTFFDFGLDMRGEALIKHKIGMIGVIDIGRHTTDYILVTDLLHTLGRASGSIPIGVSRIIDGVRRDVMHSFGRGYIATAEVEECIRRTKTIRIGNHLVDVSSIINTNLKNTAIQIAGAIQSSWDAERQTDVVLLTGGGSILMKDYLVDSFDNAQLMAGAQHANARGFYKYGVFLQKSEKSV